MTDSRITKQEVKVVSEGDAGDRRVSKQYAKVLYSYAYAPVDTRVTKQVVKVVSDGTAADRRISKQYAKVLLTPHPQIRVATETDTALPAYSNVNTIYPAKELDTALRLPSDVSDAEFTAWLQDVSAVRCILVEAIANVAAVETTRYLSTTGYITGSTDTPVHTDYLPIIAGGVKFTESLDVESDASLSFGNIELTNPDGSYDSWLDDVWVNREIKVFIGDVRWSRRAFRKIFDGITADISSPNFTTLNINIRDKLQRLNTPVIEDTLGGSTVNKDKLIPTSFGEVFNVAPLLTNEATHEYQIHNGALEDIIEVRDNGVPISYTKHLPTGKFILDQNPYGTITASIQGDKPTAYNNTVADLVARLATGYGKASEQFTTADIDLANFSDFSAANQQPVGLYLNSRTNVLAAINQLASSVGAQAVMSRAGQLRLLKVELPASGVATAITTDDIVENSLSASRVAAVRSSIKLGYCKNYTVQAELETGIPEDHKVLFSEVWLDRVSTDAAVEAIYKLDAEPVRKETLLLVESDTDTEAARLLTFFKTPRTVYNFKGGTQLIELELGDRITLTHPRFGLSSGVDGMVVKIQIDWISFKVTVGVIT